MIFNDIKISNMVLGEAVLCCSQLVGRHNHKINNFVKRTPFIARHNVKKIYMFLKNEPIFEANRFFLFMNM